MNLIALAMKTMDGLTIFGLVAVSLMLLFYALEDRSNIHVIAFAGAGLLGSIYGFLQGLAVWLGRGRLVDCGSSKVTDRPQIRPGKCQLGSA